MAADLFPIDIDYSPKKPSADNDGGPRESFKSEIGCYQHGSVVTHDEICSRIGRDVLTRLGGNAVDAAVAAMLCSGVIHPQSAGLGGGAVWVIYDRDTGWHAVNGMETAPAAATRDMFTKEEDRIKSLQGGLAVAVPGELKSLVDIHTKLGKVPWEKLATPAFTLAKNGCRLNKFVHKVLMERQDLTGFDDFLDVHGKPLPVGSVVTQPALAKTLDIIRTDPMSFYSGDLAKDVVADILDAGGIITLADLKNYTVKWKPPLETELPGGLTFYTMPPPGSGAVTSYILSVLSGYNFNEDSMKTDESKILTYHRIVEAMKFAFGKRSALGDDDFVDTSQVVSYLTSRTYGENTRKRITDNQTQSVDYYDPSFSSSHDSGTSHVSVVDGTGNAVSATSSINTYFGCGVIGRRTGITFNNHMDDFSTPNVPNFFGVHPSEANYIAPGKCPLSCMTPSIVFDPSKWKVRMVVGSAGGTRISSSTASIIMNSLWFKIPLGKALDFPRLHHQLMPNVIKVDAGFPPAIRKGLEAKGHVFEDNEFQAPCQAIDIHDTAIFGASDFRKGGKPAGY